jgi:hypothetical protein
MSLSLFCVYEVYRPVISPLSLYLSVGLIRFWIFSFPGVRSTYRDSSVRWFLSLIYPI